MYDMVKDPENPIPRNLFCEVSKDCSLNSYRHWMVQFQMTVINEISI